MKPLQQSIESEKLSTIIREKTSYYNKLYRQDPDNQYLLILNSEITFLRDIIMPIVLMNTTVLYSGLAHFITRAMREVEGRKDREKLCGVLMYYQSHQLQANEVPLVAVASNIKMTPDHMIDMTVDGKEALTIPVWPKLAEQQQEEWYAALHRRLKNMMLQINPSDLKTSQQKFIYPNGK